jgi:hypothetical protein
MVHRKWKTVLLLSSLAGVLVFSRSLLGEENEAADRSNSAKIIAKKLKMPLLLPNYENAPLREVINDIAKKSNVIITIDFKGLEEKGVDIERPITFKVNRELMLKSILHLILESPHLKYEVMEDGILICSESHFDARIVKRKYYIADLAPSPAEMKKLKAAILSIVKEDAPEGTFKADNVIFSEDGKQVTIEQARRVHDHILEYIRILRNEEDQKVRDQLYKGWLKIEDFLDDSGK